VKIDDDVKKRACYFNTLTAKRLLKHDVQQKSCDLIQVNEEGIKNAASE
jgi:hypothetical protein